MEEDMEEEEAAATRSYLFQVPLQEADIRVYKKPAAQSAVAPQNCVAVTSQLLGLITPSLAEKLSKEGAPPIREPQIQARINQHIDDDAKKYIAVGQPLTSEVIDTLRADLFPKCGTIVLSQSSSGAGHAFVVMRPGKDGAIRIVDPQPQLCSGTTNEEILAMIRHPYREEISPAGAGGPQIRIIVFRSNTARSESRIMKEYIEGPFSRMVGKRLGGATRRRSSLPRRRAMRSSSAKHRTYSRRQRA